MTRSLPGLALWILIAAQVALGCAGCLGERCDDGQRYERGRCVVEASDGGRPDADVGGDADLGGRGEAGTASLGELCTASEACASPANLCVILPNQTSGYCTVEGCSPGGDDCPEPSRFSCQDLSSISPGQAPLCLLTCDLQQNGQCPEGYGCTDLSLLLGGLPPICFPE